MKKRKAKKRKKPNFDSFFKATIKAYSFIPEGLFKIDRATAKTIERLTKP